MVLELAPEMRRLVNVGRAAVAKYPTHLQSRVVDRTDIKGLPYNLQPENIYDELLSVAMESKARLEDPKKDLQMKKREYLCYYAAFSDQHNEYLGEVLTLDNDNYVYEVVRGIEKKSNETGRALTVSEQLSCALEKCNSNLTLAIVSLALGSRHMARGMDICLLPDLVIDEERMIKWKKCVAPFGCQEIDDSAGDNYHFWHAVVAGMSIEEGLQSDFVERFKAQVGKLLYDNVEKITDIIRHKFAGREGELHGTIDILGFNIGRGLYASLKTGQ